MPFDRISILYIFIAVSFFPCGLAFASARGPIRVDVVTLEIPPFMMRRQEANKTIWYGYCMDFFLELLKHLPYNVTYEIYQVADNKFGAKDRQLVPENDDQSSAPSKKIPNYKKLESWNGLVGDLDRGKADLALAPLSVMAERELVIDFTVPFYDLVGIQILLRKPEVPRDWFKFLTVLDGEVWFSITLAYFVTSFVIFLFDRLSPYSHKNLSRIQRMRRLRDKKLKFEPPSDINTLSQSVEKDSSERPNGVSVDKDHLTRSHQLFIGSSQAMKRGSIFGKVDPMTGERRPSLFPHWLREHRGSMALNDYFKSIQLKSDNDNQSPNGADSDESDVDDGKPDFGFRDSLWFCITSLTPQGGGEAPQNLSGRVVAGAWWLFCFIIIASYTANLAAFLTVSRLDIPIDSLDDLAKQYRIKYAPVDGTAEQTYFERMAYIEEIFYNIWKEMSLNDSLSNEERSKFAVWDYPISDKYTKIWAQIQQVGMPPDMESGLRRVKGSKLDDGFALIADSIIVKHAVMTDCNLKAVGDEFSRKPIALGLRKGLDEFRDDLSYAILQLINQRFMEILREKWWTNNPDRVDCENNDESEGISIENIGGVFVIIIAGVLLSLIAWAMERFVYKTKVWAAEETIRNA